MGRRPKMTKAVQDLIVDAILNGHTISSACELAKVARQTEYAYRMKDDDYRKRVDEALDSRNELVEDALFVTALSGNVQAQRFFLINRGRPRWRSEFGKAIEESGGVGVLAIPVKEISVVPPEEIEKKPTRKSAKRRAAGARKSNGPKKPRKRAKSKKIE